MSLREYLKEQKINLKRLLEMYDDWNGISIVNDNELNVIVEDRTVNIYDNRKELLQKEVVAFGFYDGVFTVRIK